MVGSISHSYELGEGLRASYKSNSRLRSGGQFVNEELSNLAILGECESAGGAVAVEEHQFIRVKRRLQQTKRHERKQPHLSLQVGPFVGVEPRTCVVPAFYLEFMNEVYARITADLFSCSQ